METNALIRHMKSIDGIRRMYEKGVPSGKTGVKQVMDDVAFLIREIEAMQVAILSAGEHLKAGQELPQTFGSAVYHALALLSPYLPE